MLRGDAQSSQLAARKGASRQRSTAGIIEHDDERLARDHYWHRPPHD